MITKYYSTTDTGGGGQPEWEKLPAAVSILCDNLKDCSGYYYGWQSNIAMAFCDAFSEWLVNTPGTEVPTYQELHTISNKAATNFLNLLISEQKPSPIKGEEVDALESKIEKLLRTTPLKTRLKVSNWMEFVDLIVSLGYRENKAWGEDENELNYKITLAADKYADRIIETVAEFYKDASVDAEPSPQEAVEFAEWLQRYRHYHADKYCAAQQPNGGRGKIPTWTLPELYQLFKSNK